MTGKEVCDALRKGVSLDEMSRTSGVSYTALRSRAYRHRMGTVAEPAAKKPEGSDASQAKRVKELEKLVEKQQEMLATARKPRVTLGTGTARSRADGDYVRVVIPDSHGSKIDRQAADAFLADLEALRPREIVMLGDHVDCGGFLAQHHTLGYVAESSYTFEDDVGAANAFLDAIQKRCPDADIHYLMGNHERRVETWCITQSLRNQQDAAYLKRTFGIPSVLSLATRGIKTYDQGQFYDGLGIPATIKLGKCFFTHGSRTGRYSAASMLSDFGGNVVFGHVHSIDQATRRTVTEGAIGAWCIGCLCEIQPMWMHTQITNWSHGYAVQFVQQSGDFLHVTVPVLGGKSLLLPLTQSIT